MDHQMEVQSHHGKCIIICKDAGEGAANEDSGDQEDLLHTEDMERNDKVTWEGQRPANW